MGQETIWGTVSFHTLMAKFIEIQSQVISLYLDVTSRISTATPGKFLLLQFATAQMVQVGETASNIVYMVANINMNTVRNTKTS